MPKLLKLPSAVSQSAFGLAWTNPNNALVQDGSYALNAVGPGGGGGTAKQLQLTGFGYSLPSTAVIDGIVLEIYQLSDRTSTSDVYLLYSGGSTSHSTTNDPAWTASAGWLTYGSPTDKWGRSWTAAEINNAAFGASMSAFPPTGVWNIGVDGVRITVYYHLGGSTTPADVPTREVFKVYNQQGQYIGNMPKPVDAMSIPQDINSLGSQISLKIPVSVDTAGKPTLPYTTEDESANYTDEAASSNYTSGTELPIASAAFQGIDSLIKNGNTVQCWLYNYFYPNGKCMFIGKIRRWEAEFGNGDAVTIVLYSSSYDMDNYVTRGAPFTYTPDQTQAAQNATAGITVDGGKGAGWNKYGQIITTGVGITNIGAITLKLLGSADVTVNLYSSLYGTLLASTTQNVNVGGATDVQFGFPSLVNTTASTQYFFEVLVGAGQSITIYYQNTDVYAGGAMYNSNYAGGSGGGAWGSMAADLYFIVGYGTPSTQAVFNSKDPSTGMLTPILTDYNLRGGAVVWTASTIDATGLSLSYTFNVQTIYEALQAILSLAPNGFYYYVDIGANTIYFKNASTTADFLIQKGVDINALKLVTTTENSINTELFTGGETSPGVNLYKIYTDAQSIAAFGPLLERKTDNRVTLAPTANAIGLSRIAEFKGEQYQTTITLIHTTKRDLTLMTPGKIIGFRGFGTFVDAILAQIVRREWSAGQATFTLGVLPTRLPYEYNQTTRQLIAEQTQNNPATPS